MPAEGVMDLVPERQRELRVACVAGGLGKAEEVADRPPTLAQKSLYEKSYSQWRTCHTDSPPSPVENARRIPTPSTPGNSSAWAQARPQKATTPSLPNST